MNPNKIPPEIIWALLAMFGGIAKYLDIYLREGGPIVWMKFIASVTVSAFAGFMSAHMMILIYPSWVFIAAGIGGYASTKILDLLVDLLRYRLGEKNGNEPKTKK